MILLMLTNMELLLNIITWLQLPWNIGPNHWTLHGMCTNIIYLDITKAYDIIPHTQLLSKLSIGDHLLKCITHCLIGRKQCIVLNGCKSNWAPVRSDFPQGTILGSNLFIIYSNGLSYEQLMFDVHWWHQTLLTCSYCSTQIIMYFRCKE